ncbi:Site-specific DNA-cytosine methylase [Nostoc flagelliforme CCNUN1]|uniref:Site-specific DNA-cytosine methylase n=1 Tax=Nostoc flagelliforme CCNUN1 TaxID=2038116 RepID=A0A2K8T277_9NOSO|nr:hypothetical protein [Nostoc flagelliforme]AUB41802.1 Site-specific DNA-cytosine methylase [Nostoc flagelliforme CCNUN1]
MNKPPSKRKKATPAASNDSTLPNDLAEEDISPQENPALATITVTAVEIPELTEQEISDRLHLERKVERAFFEAGKALAQLRDRRLYRSTHRTFEEYCRDRFGYTHRRVNYLIAGSVVFDNIVAGTNCSQNEEVDETRTNCSQNEEVDKTGTNCSQNGEADETGTNCSQNEEVDKTRLNPSRILPTNEGQVRPLAPLEPQQQVKVWQWAVHEAGGKVPSARIVTDVVQRIMERTRIPNTYQIGEVCQILAKDNPELRGKGGCWAIVSSVNDFSCTVRVWDGEYTVGLQHMKSFNYLPQECKQVQEISDRISRVYSDLLEETVKSLLQSLGKVNRPYLTELEEKLLSLLESEVKVS